MRLFHPDPFVLGPCSIKGTSTYEAAAAAHLCSSPTETWGLAQEEGIFIVCSGVVRVEVQPMAGVQETYYLGTGGIFGLWPALTGRPHPRSQAQCIGLHCAEAMEAKLVARATIAMQKCSVLFR